MKTPGKGSWCPHWERLLSLVAGSVPQAWMVIVMADRGLYALWLYQQMVRQGWHPILRVNEQMHVRWPCAVDLEGVCKGCKCAGKKKGK